MRLQMTRASARRHCAADVRKSQEDRHPPNYQRDYYVHVTAPLQQAVYQARLIANRESDYTQGPDDLLNEQALQFIREEFELKKYLNPMCGLLECGCSQVYLCC
jgi:hypothetical protein